MVVLGSRREGSTLFVGEALKGTAAQQRSYETEQRVNGKVEHTGFTAWSMRPLGFDHDR